MEKIGKINQREIYYVNQRNNPKWQFYLPENNWLLFAIAHEEDVRIINEFSEKCLDKNVAYICGTGPAGYTLEDVFDLEFINRKINNKQEIRSFAEEAPITSWHDDFDEGFWFAATAAHHSMHQINCVVCINLSKRDYRRKIRELVNKINQGWNP